MATRSKFPMITIPEAQTIVLNESRPLEPLQTPFVDALGLVLAEDVIATQPHPHFRASIKDGYAVVASDGVGDFPVVAELRAGTDPSLTLQPGQVAYITTGSPVPEGADAVIQVEDTEPLPPSPGGRRLVRILKPSKPGQDIRAVGSDIAPGEAVLTRGTLLRPAEVGLLATVGRTAVAVHRGPLVAVMSTGDEVVEPETRELRPGQVRDSNRSMLLAAVRGAGCPVSDLGVAPDSAEGLEALLDRAIGEGMNVLITSGGVSMGDRDLVKPLLEKRGTIHFGRVLMKPGKPLTFATLDVPPGNEEGPGRRVYVFGLPGNPVSSIVCLHLTVLPCIRKLSGWSDPLPRRVHCLTSSDLKLDPERPEYHRAMLTWEGPPEGGATGRLVAHSTGNQISSRLMSARAAHAVLELPQRAGVLPKGTVVGALLIDDLRTMGQ